MARARYERRQARRVAARTRSRARRKALLSVLAAATAVVLVAGLAWAVSTWVADGEAPTVGASPTRGAGTAATCRYPAADPRGGEAVPPPPATPQVTGRSTATIKLADLGTVRLELDADGAPCTTSSFRHLAALGFYDDTPCHRLTATPSLKVLQCGDPSATGSGGPGYSVPDEALEGATYPAGTVAMANAGPDTGGSQFFLVYADSELPPKYTPFGRITGGMDVLRRIAKAGIQNDTQDGKPKEPVVIESVTVSPPVSPVPTRSPTPRNSS